MNTGGFTDANMEADTVIHIPRCRKSKMQVQLQVEMKLPHLFRDNIDSGTSKRERGGHQL